jgi:hypothetical protein
MVCDDDGGTLRNGFVGYSLGKIDRKEDGVRLAARWNEGRFEEETGIIP